MNYYKILGVSYDATSTDIKKAYKKLAMKHHPDKGGDAQAFANISEAYNVLIDSTKRKKYDNENQSTSFTGFNYKPDFTKFAKRKSFGFHTIRQDNINADIFVEYNIDLKTAFVGGKHEVKYQVPGGNVDSITIDLEKCVKDGKQFFFEHKGEAKFTHQPRGDLYVTIKILPDDNFWFEGEKLCTRIVVDIFDAIFGAKKTVKRIDGKEFEFTIEAGSQAGTKYRFKNQGYNNNDFIVYLVVSTPKITDKHILEKLKEIETLIKQDQEQK